MIKDTKKRSLEDILEELYITLEDLNDFISEKEAENRDILNELRAIYPAREIDMLRNMYYDNSDDIADATQVFNSIREILGGNYE